MRRAAGSNQRVAQIEYGAQPIAVTVTFVAGDRLSISVHPDLRVTANAPAAQPWDAIMLRLKKRAGWIIRQQREFSRYQPGPTARRYVSGETHYYLGRQYRLKVRQSDSPGVRMQGGYIHVDTPDRADTDKIREQVRGWYRTRATEVLVRRYALCFEQLRTLGVRNAVPVLRRMVKRWGSCTKAGHILLNPDLVKVPVPCVDYVIIHEMCHLKVLGHTAAFYRLLGRHMPDWEMRRRRLNSFLLTE